MLNLNDTSLGNDGAAAVALALAQSAPELEELGLALNEITPQGKELAQVADVWCVHAVCGAALDGRGEAGPARALGMSH